MEDDIKEYASEILRKHFHEARRDVEQVIKDAEGLSSQTTAHVQDFEAKVVHYGQKQTSRAKVGVKRLQKEISGVVSKIVGSGNVDQ